jgi:hypothetical protein
MKATTKVKTTARQFLWFVGLWAGGVGVTALVGYGIKLWLR